MLPQAARLARPSNLTLVLWGLYLATAAFVALGW
jgi:hypothetical protein